MVKIEKGMFMSLISDRSMFDMIIDFNNEMNIVKTRKGGNYPFSDVVLYKEIYYEDFSTEEDYGIIKILPLTNKENITTATEYEWVGGTVLKLKIVDVEFKIT